MAENLEQNGGTLRRQ